jgi:hypothetical protein
MTEILTKPNLPQEKGIHQFGNISLGTKVGKEIQFSIIFPKKQDRI